jgi:hypothetical protein
MGGCRRWAVVIGVAAPGVLALGAQSAIAAKPKPQEQHISLWFSDRPARKSGQPG